MTVVGLDEEMSEGYFSGSSWVSAIPFLFLSVRPERGLFVSVGVGILLEPAGEVLVLGGRKCEC